jgi:acetyl esterase
MTETTSVVALDPAVKAALDSMGNFPYADLEQMTLEQAMQIARPRISPPPAPANTRDKMIGGYRDAETRVRLYFPEVPRTGLPILIYLHGGGFVGGTVEMDDARCQWFARNAECIVASVDYRLAPEHAFPIAIEDAFAAWKWVTANAAEFGGDAERCAISGSSAGGHIAVGVTLLARERRAPMPLLQLLTYPVIDPRRASDSYRHFGAGPFMTRARMAWYWKQYAGNPGDHLHLWNPMSAAATGLPPIHVITAEYDVLRDEGEAYAAHLDAAGIEATVERHARMIHGFITIVPDHETSKTALKNSAAALRKVFSKSQ